MSSAPPYTVNCSILLTHLPLHDRPAAAKEAGFEGVEFWWPFAAAVPAQDEVDAFVATLRDAGVQLTGLNFAAGDMPAGDRGLMSWPERSDEVRANLDVVTSIGERTGCRAFNALYGNRQVGADPIVQDALGAQNLALAARAVARIDGVVLLEPVSGAPSYPLLTSDDVVTVLDRVAAEHGARNLGLLLDVYHLSVNGTDVSSQIVQFRDRIRHVQVADAPGRGAPGTGTLPIEGWVADLRAGGFDGPIGLEYTAPAGQEFDWLALGLRGGPPRTPQQSPDSSTDSSSTKGTQP